MGNDKSSDPADDYVDQSFFSFKKSDDCFSPKSHYTVLNGEVHKKADTFLLTDLNGLKRNTTGLVVLSDCTLIIKTAPPLF